MSCNIRFICLLCVYRQGVGVDNVIMLKISQKGDKGFRIASVPSRKLKRMALDKHRFWSLEGLESDWLVLHSY